MFSIFKKTLVLSTLLSIIFFCLVPGILVFAAETQYVPLEPLPGTTNPDNPASTDIYSYVPGMFKLLIGVAAALAVLMIIIGGVQYIGSESLWGKQDGKEKIQKAIWGLLLAIFAYLLLYSINPNILQFNLNIAPAEFPQSSAPDTPHFVRSLYRVTNSPTTFVGCSGSYPNLQTCEANVTAESSQYATPPKTLVGASCAQNCVPATPTNPTTGLDNGWYKIRRCIMPGTQANTVTILHTFLFQTYGGSGPALQACNNATPQNGTVTPPPSSPCISFIYACIENEH